MEIVGEKKRKCSSTVVVVVEECKRGKRKRHHHHHPTVCAIIYLDVTRLLPLRCAIRAPKAVQFEPNRIRYAVRTIFFLRRRRRGFLFQNQLTEKRQQSLSE